MYLCYRSRRAAARPHANGSGGSPGSFGRHFAGSGGALGREQPPQVGFLRLDRFGEQLFLRE